MGDRRKTRGPPYGWPTLPRPAPGQPGPLRFGILADSLCFSSLVPHGPLTSAACDSKDPAPTKVPSTVVPSSPLARAPTPWITVARTPRTKSRRQTTLLTLPHLAMPPPVTQGRSHSLLCLLTSVHLLPCPPHLVPSCLKSLSARCFHHMQGQGQRCRGPLAHS
jgi:hypothetical protein